MLPGCVRWTLSSAISSLALPPPRLGGVAPLPATRPPTALHAGSAPTPTDVTNSPLGQARLNEGAAIPPRRSESEARSVVAARVALAAVGTVPSDESSILLPVTEPFLIFAVVTAPRLICW